VNVIMCRKNVKNFKFVAMFFHVPNAPKLRPRCGPQWWSLRRSPRFPSRRGRGTPSPNERDTLSQCPSPRQSLRRLDHGAHTATRLSGPQHKALRSAI